MSHHKTLIGTITDKAKETCNKSITSDEDYKIWEQHWLATGRIWCEELRKEGLSSTVKGLEKIIFYFEGIINGKQGQNGNVTDSSLDG